MAGNSGSLPVQVCRVQFSPLHLQSSSLPRLSFLSSFLFFYCSLPDIC